MSTRTVRLDEDAERTLERVTAMTGLSSSEALKQSLTAYENGILEQGRRKPYEIFRQLDLGDGGYAIAPARNAKSAIVEAIRRKHVR